MDIKNESNLPQAQQPPKKRPSRAKKKGKEKKTDPIAKLVDRGWAKEGDISANTVFVPGPMVIQGRLHATDKLCLRGDFVVTNRLECEGTFTLCGELSCWDKPAVVKNMVIYKKGTINGDVVVNSGAFIKGKCRIHGNLTVTGLLRIDGTLTCKSLDLTGTIERFGNKSQLIVEGDSVINREDSALTRLARLLTEEVSNQEQGGST